MQQSNQNDFILTSIAYILDDVVSASAGIGEGIETYPLCDYVMQSVFLKMTGSQEQKMKCVRWELATNDYEYRYEFTKNSLGECSSYKDKQTIYKDLVKQIKKRSPGFDVKAEIDKQAILDETTSTITRVFAKSNLRVWAQKRFDEFNVIWGDINTKLFVTEINNKNNDNHYNLFTEVISGCSLKKIYENHLYRHRNRVAHNTQSYQQNLPTLQTLIQEEYKYDNYFIFFSVLILIDRIFIELYKKYLILLEEGV